MWARGAYREQVEVGTPGGPTRLGREFGRDGSSTADRGKPPKRRRIRRIRRKPYGFRCAASTPPRVEPQSSAATVSPPINAGPGTQTSLRSIASSRRRSDRRKRLCAQPSVATGVSTPCVDLPCVGLPCVGLHFPRARPTPPSSSQEVRNRLACGRARWRRVQATVGGDERDPERRRAPRRQGGRAAERESSAQAMFQPQSFCV